MIYSQGVSRVRKAEQTAETGWISAMLTWGNPGIQRPVFSLLSAADVERNQYPES